MPFVTLEWLVGRSPAQKRAVAEAITAAICEHADVRSEDVWVRIVDVAPQDWAIGGRTQA